MVASWSRRPLKVKRRLANRSRAAAHGTTSITLSLRTRTAEGPMSYSVLRAITFVAVLIALATSPAHAARKQKSAAHHVSLESVNNAEWHRGNMSTALLIKVQVMLDRAHASPGEIDASRGENKGTPVNIGERSPGRQAGRPS